MSYGTGKRDGSPGYFLLTASSLDWNPYTSAADIIRRLTAHRIWLASRFTPYQHLYKAGDRVLFYAAGHGYRCFMGDAVVAGSVSPTTAQDEALAAALGLDGFHHRIPLTEVRVWPTPVRLKPLVEEMEFVKDKKNWGQHVRQAARRVTASDYTRILEEAGVVPAGGAARANGSSG